MAFQGKKGQSPKVTIQLNFNVEGSDQQEIHKWEVDRYSSVDMSLAMAKHVEKEDSESLAALSLINKTIKNAKTIEGTMTLQEAIDSFENSEEQDQFVQYITALVFDNKEGIAELENN